MFNWRKLFRRNHAPMTRLDLLQVLLLGDIERVRMLASRGGPDAAAVFGAELSDYIDLRKNWPTDRHLRCGSCNSSLALAEDAIATFPTFNCARCMKRFYWWNTTGEWRLSEGTQTNAATESVRPEVKAWMRETIFRTEEEIAALMRHRARGGATPNQVAQELLANGLPVIQ